MTTTIVMTTTMRRDTMAMTTTIVMTTTMRRDTMAVTTTIVMTTTFSTVMARKPRLTFSNQIN